MQKHIVKVSDNGFIKYYHDIQIHTVIRKDLKFLFCYSRISLGKHLKNYNRNEHAPLFDLMVMSIL